MDNILDTNDNTGELGTEVFPDSQENVVTTSDTVSSDNSDGTSVNELQEDSTIGMEYENNEAGYEELAQQDLSELKSEFPELSKVGDITQLENPLRYAALRDMGLSPREAYLATSSRPVQRDNRSHLYTAAPRGASSPTANMSRAELLQARELFDGMSDTEIYNLYKKVTR